MYGDDRDPVREVLVYPLIFAQIPDLSDAFVVDLGCGNGGLLHRILDRSFARAIGFDISTDFLAKAQQLVSDARVSFVQADITKRLPVENSEVDCILSVFVLNEIRQLDQLFRECSRILKPSGAAHFIVTHPFLVAQAILHQKYKGLPLGKLSGLIDYKSREPFEYRFTLANVSARFYQHTFEEYVDVITATNLRLTKLIEMRTDDAGFRAYEQYWSERDVPKYAYLRVTRLMTEEGGSQ